MIVMNSDHFVEICFHFSVFIHPRVLFMVDQHLEKLHDILKMKYCVSGL